MRGSGPASRFRVVSLGPQSLRRPMIPGANEHLPFCHPRPDRDARGRWRRIRWSALVWPHASRSAWRAARAQPSSQRSRRGHLHRRCPRTSARSIAAASICRCGAICGPESSDVRRSARDRFMSLASAASGASSLGRFSASATHGKPVHRSMIGISRCGTFILTGLMEVKDDGAAGGVRARGAAWIHGIGTETSAGAQRVGKGQRERAVG